MEETRHPIAGAVLLAVFVVFLLGYFLASYMAHSEIPRVAEKPLSQHDDLLAIDGGAHGGKAAVGKFGLILITQDGGKTWQRRQSGTVKTLSAVSFADAQHGWVVGSGGTMLSTTDAGGTWRAVNGGVKDQLLGVAALSGERIFAVGAFGILLSTSDGGQTWTKHELKWDSLIERIVKDGGYVEPNLNAVSFSSADSGWVVGEFGLVLHTADGGKTWTSQRYGSDFPQLYAVKFIDDRRGWALGQAGSLIQTKDGGQHWTPVELETKRDLYDISVDGTHGIIVGDGVILATLDNGATWKSAVRDEQKLTAVSLKSSEAIAVGHAGTIRVLPLTGGDMEKKKEVR